MRTEKDRKARNTLWPLLNSGCMQEKISLDLKLRESTDQTLRDVNAKVVTDWRWTVQTELDQYKPTPRYWEEQGCCWEKHHGSGPGKLQRPEGDAAGGGDKDGMKSAFKVKGGAVLYQNIG